MRKFILLFFTVVGISLIFNSCEKKFIDITAPAGTALFKTDIVPIFASKCIGCHSTQNPILENDVAYDNLINGGYVNTSAPASSKIYVHITNSTHRKFPAEGEKILQWITEGALNN